MPNPHRSELQGGLQQRVSSLGFAMVFSLFRRGGNRQTIDRLHAAIVDAARQETFFCDYAVADSVDGRFELLVLHAAFLTRRLNAAARPGPDIAQDLTNAVFRNLDASLREVGIGDTSVPKRMKKLAQAFFGRANAYGEALSARDNDALEQALARNVYAGSAPGTVAKRLGRYVRTMTVRLDALTTDNILANETLYPDPALIA